jgi:hypothetical protein
MEATLVTTPGAGMTTVPMQAMTPAATTTVVGELDVGGAHQHMHAF